MKRIVVVCIALLAPLAVYMRILGALGLLK